MIDFMDEMDADPDTPWEKRTFTAPCDGYFEITHGHKQQMKKGDIVQWMESEPEEDEEIEYKIYGD